MEEIFLLDTAEAAGGIVNFFLAPPANGFLPANTDLFLLGWSALLGDSNGDIVNN